MESYPEGVEGRSVYASFLHNGTVLMFERRGFDSDPASRKAAPGRREGRASGVEWGDLARKGANAGEYLRSSRHVNSPETSR